MFSHITVGVNDLEASKRFYDAIFGVMGVGSGVAGKARYYYRSATGSLGIVTPVNGQPATHGNGGTIGLNAQSQAEVDAFHAAAVAHGGVTCEDPPGLREGAAGKMYLAYLRDPDGNKLCAVYRLPKTA